MGQSAEHRHEKRSSIALSAQCRTHSGLRDCGSISDISADGCCVTTNGLFVRIGARVMIKPDGMEALTGVIRWIDGFRAGVQFDTPLYGPVLEHLAAAYGTGQTLGIAKI